MKRLVELVLIGCLLAGAVVAANRPNIVFIFSDDHAYQAISAYGGDLHQTPNIDRLAKEGMRFDRCYVTNSICGPSRATILTGKYSHLNGFYKNDMSFNGAQQTFPKLLKGAGYQTAVIGKWHLKSKPTGFTHYDVITCYGGQGKYFNPVMMKNGVNEQQTGYTTDVISEKGLKWLKETRDPHKPFMLMLQHKAPHRGWQPSVKYHQQYKDRVFAEPDTLFDDYATRGTAVKTQDMSIGGTMTDNDLKLVPPGYLKGEDLENWHAAYDAENAALKAANLTGKALVRWKYQRYIREYLRCVSSVDDSVGEVLDYLDKSGLAENTLVIYSSDQGFYLGEHGWFDKRFMYEESLRTPLLMRWPGQVKPGSVDAETIVSNLDFAETFLDVAGVKTPADMQGRSLVPVLKQAVPKDWRKSFYYHYYGYPDWHLVRQHCGVTNGRYKLIDFYSVGELELFDLKNDRKELTNLADNPEYKEILAQMQAELRRQQADLKVPSEAETVARFKAFEGTNSYLKWGKPPAHIVEKFGNK